MILRDSEYLKIKTLLYEHTGISLRENKHALVEARLNKFLKKMDLKNFSDYIKIVKEDDEQLNIFINALTTNKTEFFRENEHFIYLRKIILPHFESKHSYPEKFNIWSAASSTGEEVYSLAMCMEEYFGAMSDKYRILGTDLDTDVLATAQAGVYKSNSLLGIDKDVLNSYFYRGVGNKDGLCRVNEVLKAHIKFRQFNLIQDELQGQVKFDIIFLRNVLIYFEPDTIQQVIQKLSEKLKLGGHLFIGHSESLNRINHGLKYVAPSVFKKVN